MTAESALNISTHNDVDLERMGHAIRFLALDAIKAANSGHTGMPMGMADIATVLYSKFLKFSAAEPNWPDRDRVIISNGHGSMLPYSLSYLTGNQKITLDEIKNFRQLGSHTPGHPEVDKDAAIETTTGPLGQGISNSVGFAIAERILNARYGDDLINHYTYVFTGDGCLMEGVSQEACSLAGHLKLSKMIVFYDDNNVTIDGTIDLTFSDDVPKRFEAYGWETMTIDGHDHDAIADAISKAQKSDKPTLISCKTKIGYGVPSKECQPAAHGAITNDNEIQNARENMNWDHAPFEIPDDILNWWRDVGAQHKQTLHDWKNRLNSHDMRDCFEKFHKGDFSGAIAPVIAELKKEFASERPSKATRQTSGMCLEKLVDRLWLMVGGSADLTGSNNTKVSGSAVFDRNNYGGNYINYGVREHGMAAIMNGMALHSPLVPYSGTFLQFADYARPSMRLAALMEQRVIHVMTHDSIGLGEDGPTHQPVEHVAALRAIPNLYVYRPCDGIETAESWELAIGSMSSPSVLALTRQGLPTLCDDRDENMVAKGAYILKENGDKPEVTLFAAGSEVSLAHEAYEQLTGEGKAVRLVSVPCMDRFMEGDEDHFVNLVCNNSVKVAVEAGIRQGWDGIIGAHSPFIGMNSFGASAPADVLFKHFGITTEAILEAVKKKLG